MSLKHFGSIPHATMAEILTGHCVWMRDRYKIIWIEHNILTKKMLNKESDASTDSNIDMYFVVCYTTIY